MREAIRAYEELLNVRDEWHFTSVVAGISTYLARHNLARCLMEIGDLDLAAVEWQRLVAGHPGYQPGCHGLVDACVQRAQRHGTTSAVRKELEQLRKAHQSNPEILRAVGQFLFEYVAPGAAESALREMLNLDPMDASTWHNLGMVLWTQKRYAEAAEAYEASLQSRPDHAATLLWLSYALKDCGRVAEAHQAAEKVVALVPESSLARDAQRVLSSHE